MEFELKKNRTPIGKVTESERDEIKNLFERKNGLTELFKIVTIDNNTLYDKVVQDMGTTATKFQAWWDNKSKQYNWASKEGYSWEIDFETSEIFLSKN